MPSYVSKDGIWYPAKEHAVLPHLSGTDKEVYDGPDRAAEFELAQAFGVDTDGKPKEVTFGVNFRDDPDLIDRARQLGYKDVMEYAVSRGYDPVKSEKLFKEKAAEIIKHKPLDRKPEKALIGGGVDTSGKGGDLIGGFGDERERPAKELEK
jgi:hypothetical protein